MDMPALNVPYTPQISEWIEHSPGNVHDRLVQYGLAGLQPPLSYSSSSSSHPHSTNPRSVGSGSSMTPALLHHPPASAGTPSLYSSKTHASATTASSSVSTGLVDHGLLASYPLLSEDNGVLVQPLLHTETPVLRCVFWFLDCGFLCHDREQWETHTLSHFRGEAPPRSVVCPLCDWEASRDDALGAWRLKMAHLADHHFAFGHTLSTSRPDFHLFHHLWQKRLIDDEDLKELKGGNHNLARPPGTFVRTNGRGPRRERERNARRQRLQHVPQGQPGRV
ncbi:hypothetical protein SVAN01_00311 [Stagonosporopsis vannaccii]|nr:hypothetical protein SVAN01_00311 [Stagonosporopsis vannaccii]